VLCAERRIAFGVALRGGNRAAEILSRLSKPFFFSLGVSRGDISLFQRERNEIMKGGELLISATRLHWREAHEVAKHSSMSDLAISRRLRTDNTGDLPYV
jgi:hypothetical protein